MNEQEYQKLRERISELEEMRSEAVEMGEEFEDEDREELNYLKEQRRAHNVAKKIWSAWDSASTVYRVSREGDPSILFYALSIYHAMNALIIFDSVEEAAAHGITIKEVERPANRNGWDFDVIDRVYYPPEGGQ